MSQFHPTISRESLQDKVIVLTGGAHGIGKSLVELCTQHGAYVCFGDIDEKAGRGVEESANASQKSSPPTARFVPVDVTNYQSVLSLFKTALSLYGRIDHVVANAGIVERGNWFDPALTVESVEEQPTTKVLDVNLLGCLYTARIASVYLRQNRREGQDRSLTLVSSVAGFKESPGLFVYQASKHGVLGLMRSLRKYITFPTTHNIRVNAICPWMTETAMVAGIEDGWRKAQLPINQPLDVAKVITGVLAAEGQEERVSGMAMYVEGGRAWEIERNLDRLQPQWLGEEPSESLEKGQAVLGDGMNWAQ
ncbi:3-hydroxyacyl-CoA dehydrogenase, putative [Talaromyces stipitatus ATCC 10500]|uniref:3-hydroxyacyl-CoA dehydrogenase, putative n=1 Tax=Talaromyces stipitatus (strain ATCC 10500 / CBS 375.48 / QM 6759 / NRRL 1006) TaxID=441959 RepID=B8MP82_TALSN|nr:3-hydroxyacyl-CoA dehydrogenase, putative [Talaromyces stipitatus ATCC 10500]EED14321.1 3-hydroxyacyl-CoA dehydrogenase, putative [Talaromyces stipitatus ATCC 10500]